MRDARGPVRGWWWSSLHRGNLTRYPGRHSQGKNFRYRYPPYPSRRPRTTAPRCLCLRVWTIISSGQASSREANRAIYLSRAPVVSMSNYESGGKFELSSTRVTCRSGASGSKTVGAMRRRRDASSAGAQRITSEQPFRRISIKAEEQRRSREITSNDLVLPAR